MPLNDALNEATNKFSSQIAKDNILFNKITQKLFNTACDWSPEMLARMQASLHSTAQTGCLPGTPGCVQFDESGYNAKDFLISYFRCLLEIYAKNFHNKSQAVGMTVLKMELKTIYRMILLIQNREESAEKHWELMANILQKVQEGHYQHPLCYHAGYPGHSIYINYFEKDGRLFGAICNLGEGSDRHPGEDNINGRLVYPLVLEIDDIERHLAAIITARTQSLQLARPKQGANNHLIAKIYTSGTPVTVRKQSIELAQTTGNCVVKNYLQSFRDRHQDVNSYYSLFDAVRSVLASHIAEYDKGIRHMRDVTQLNASLASSQVSFQGATCTELTQRLTLYKSQHVLEDVKTSFIVDQGLATLGGAAGGGVLGSALTYSLVKDSKLSDGEKTLATIGGGLLFAFLGGLSGHALAEPKISQHARPIEDIEIPASRLLSCAGCGTGG